MISSIFILIIFASKLVACEPDGIVHVYNHAQADDIIRPEFLEEHRIGGVYYNNDETYDDCDESHTVLIKTEKQYEKIFYGEAPNIDFSDYMVILNIRTNVGTSGYLSIESTELDESGTLNVVVKRKMNNLDKFYGSGVKRVPVYFLLMVEWEDAKSANVIFVA